MTTTFVPTTCTTPQALHAAFNAACNRADVEAAIALYEPDALLVMHGQESRGNIAIRAALEGLFSLGGTMEMRDTKVIETGDIALVHSSFTLEAPDRGDGPIVMTGRTADVLRRQADGTWLVVIDNPFGGGA